MFVVCHDSCADSYDCERGTLLLIRYDRSRRGPDLGGRGSDVRDRFMFSPFSLGPYRDLPLSENTGRYR